MKYILVLLFGLGSCKVPLTDEDRARFDECNLQLRRLNENLERIVKMAVIQNFTPSR